MNLRFDADQPHQVRAVESVCDLFSGQVRTEAAFDLSSENAMPAVPNRLDLDEARLLANLREVQRANGLPLDEALESIEESIDTAGGERRVGFANFSVEMETGTGKTYVYLRTALELHRRYGLSKFIVVAPSVAIREGVMKTLRITRSHFAEHFENLPYRFFQYDSANLTAVRSFAQDSSLQIMVTTLASFNKEMNVLRRGTDRLSGETPIHLVQAARPVLILDEPQNMESETSVRALAALRPLFALRYSATHRNPYNVIYQLTPYGAYRKELVKRIEVAGIEWETDANRVFVRLDDIRVRTSGKPTARVAVHKLMKTGAVKEAVVTVGAGDALAKKTNRSEYHGFTVDEIDAGHGFVRFGNGVELRKGDTRGADREAIFEQQLRYTIEAHLRRQRALDDAGAGVKVLSLFFVDRVANYADDDGVVRVLFDRIWEELRAGHPRFADRDASDVREAYFAQRTTRAGDTIYEESRTGEAKRDTEAYDLIMKDKERLLSFAEPVSFIFSHSALREGWDNPNVFQICTLNQSVSEVRKRQEIGRGVRLAVNQAGERVRDPELNTLLVVANESYKRYVAAYQSELEDEYGAGELPPKPGDDRRKTTVRRRKKHELSPEFRELWEKIRRKTRYTVRIGTDRLVREVVEGLNRVEIRAPRITIGRGRVRVGPDEDRFAPVAIAEGRRPWEPKGATLPNLLVAVQEILEHVSPPIRLTRRTLLRIFRETDRFADALKNPHGFATAAAAVIRERLADQLVDGVEYHRLDEWYEMRQFDMEVERFREHLVRSEKSLYDHVEIDTAARIPEASVEGRFVREMEDEPRVRCYVKLPRWFTVDTPIGAYNPDWALVMEDTDEQGDPSGEKLYLVSETKGPSWRDEGGLREDERRKIRCGARHFGSRQLDEPGALDGIDYRVASSLAEVRSPPPPPSTL